MPPTSTNINEEGANILSLKIVSDGVYDHEGLYRVMVEEPSKYPGCSGCRNFRDVESDIKAQIAANNKGSSLLRALVEEYDLKTVHEYMEHIRKWSCDLVSLANRWYKTDNWSATQSKPLGICSAKQLQMQRPTFFMWAQFSMSQSVAYFKYSWGYWLSWRWLPDCTQDHHRHWFRLGHFRFWRNWSRIAR